MNAIIARPSAGATRGKTQADPAHGGVARTTAGDADLPVSTAPLAGKLGLSYALIAPNGSGDIHLSSRADLLSFGTERSTLLASMTVILSHLVVGIGSSDSGPDYCFVSDFAAHVQDLAYQVEQANRLLSAGEGA